MGVRFGMGGFDYFGIGTISPARQGREILYTIFI